MEAISSPLEDITYSSKRKEKSLKKKNRKYTKNCDASCFR